jgi:DNA-binding response OmpR family regulator
MPKVLVIHPDKSACEFLASTAGQHYETEIATDLLSGVRAMPTFKPDVILVHHDSRKQDGRRLLEFLQKNVIKTPVVILGAPGTRSGLGGLVKLGSKGFLEYPIEEKPLLKAISAAIQAHAADSSAPPAICPEELNTNLSMLENRLNREMKCFAGKNQVFIKSRILGSATTKPRIALRCALRAEYGFTREVYFEYIREFCCGDPTLCEAYQRFQTEREAL